MTKNVGNHLGFDGHIDALGVVIGYQFDLTVVRFTMFSPFRVVNHNLSNSGFDWAAKHIAAGSVCNDVTIVLVHLFGETIRSLGYGSKFQVGARCVVETSRSNIERNNIK